MAHRTFEVVGFSVDKVLPNIISLREVKGEEQSTSVVVGPIGQNQISESVRGGLVVDVVDRCDAHLCEVGEVNVAFQVVHRHGDVEFHIGLNEVRTSVREVITVLGVKRGGDGEFNWIGSLVNPLFVEGEASAVVGVVAKGSIGEGQIADRCIGDPNGVGCKVLNR